MLNIKIFLVLLIVPVLSAPFPAYCAESADIGILPFSNRILPAALTRMEILQEKTDHAYDYLENAIPEMMMTELYEGHAYALVERSRMDDFEKEIKFGETGAVDEVTAPKAGKTLGAGYLFYGTIAKQNGSLILTPKLLSIKDRKEVPLQKIRTTEADILGSISKMKALIADKLPISTAPGKAGGLVPGAAIAFLPFNDNSKVKDKEGLKIRVPDRMLTEVVGFKKLNFVERMRIDGAFEELKINQSGLVDEATALKVGKMVGAKAIVFGSFITAGKTVRIDARVSEVETGRLLTAIKAEGQAKDVGVTMGMAGQRLRKELISLLNVKTGG